LGNGTEVTAEMVLNRAGALTCGGCHQFSVGREIAPGVTWPFSNGFVQVDEFGNLADALTQHFLPARKQQLEQFLCSNSVGTLP